MEYHTNLTITLCNGTPRIYCNQSALGDLAMAVGSSANRAAIVQHLARRRAMSPAAAVPFFADSAGERRAFGALLSKGIVLEAEPLRFYLDEDAVGAIRDRRLRALRVVAVAAIITGAVAIGVAVTR